MDGKIEGFLDGMLVVDDVTTVGISGYLNGILDGTSDGFLNGITD